MKKIILAILAIGILGGGAFIVKIGILDRPENPQAFVNQALANYFDIESSKFESVVNLSVTKVADFEGNLNLEVSGKIANARDYLPNLDYRIALNGKGSAAGQEAAISASGDLRILDEIFYGKLGKIELTGIPNKVLALIESTNAFTEKWYSLSFKKLKETNLKIAELFEEQEKQQVAMRENLQNFFVNNDTLMVKKLPFSFSNKQKVEVVLNPDVLTSDTFFAEIERVFTSSYLDGMVNPFEMTEEEKTEARRVIREIMKKSNPQILLRIGKKDGVLYGYDFEMDLNLADIGIGDYPIGRIKITVNSQLTEVNQPQQIVIPKNAEEVDPFNFIPTPQITEEEKMVEENVESE